MCISYILKVRSIFLLKQGRQKEALDALFNIVKFGQEIENAGGAVSHYFAGESVKKLGLEGLREMLAGTKLPASLLVEKAKELARYKASEEGLMNGFKMQYRLRKDFMDDLARGKADLEEVGLEKISKRWRGYKDFLFQPDRSKRLLERACRTRVKNVPRAFAERDYSEMPDFPEPSTPFLKFKFFLSGNTIGRLVARSFKPAIEVFHSEKCEENVRKMAVFSRERFLGETRNYV